MNPTPSKFVVAHFEHVFYTRQHETAGRQLIQLLALLDGSYGNIPHELEVRGYSLFKTREDFLDQVFTRISAAITALFCDPDFQLSPTGFCNCCLFSAGLV